MSDNVIENHTSCYGYVEPVTEKRLTLKLYELGWWVESSEAGLVLG